ncbi:hypothetical protein V2O64_01055 [Verrucomicrobiaceae bacterium 227]
MKTKLLLLAGTACSLVLASCSSTSADPHAGHDLSSMTSTGVKPYTSDKCVVTDNKLGSMGDPITMVHKGQEVKFCCKPCVAKFKANPEKYLAKL